MKKFPIYVFDGEHSDLASGSLTAHYFKTKAEQTAFSEGIVLAGASSDISWSKNLNNQLKDEFLDIFCPLDFNEFLNDYEIREENFSKKKYFLDAQKDQVFSYYENRDYSINLSDDDKQKALNFLWKEIKKQL